MLIAIFVVVFFLLMSAGLPVAFSMIATALVSGLYMWGLDGMTAALLSQRIAGGMNSFTTLAIPLFLLAGKLMNEGSITDRIFKFAKTLVGHYRGGLAQVNILTSVIFAGMSGTAAADAAGPGAMEIRAMENNGYDTEFAVAVTAGSSLIGPVIPPSVPLVTYGVLAGVSVGNLFIAGIVPGLLMALAMGALVYYYSKKRGYPKEEKVSFREALTSFRKAFLPLMAPIIIIGGIWTGIFTPTEAAAVAVLYSLILILFVYRSMNLKQLWKVFKDSMVESSAIMVIMGCVSLYGYVLTRSRIPFNLANMVFAITTNPVAIMLLLILFFLVIGCFMSTLESIMLFTPIFLPLMTEVGIDLTQFGIIMLLVLMIGQLTPPYGTVLFITTKISKLPMNRVVAACAPFAIPVFAVVALCIIFPSIVTFLPNLF